jgi:hypothetical protein
VLHRHEKGSAAASAVVTPGPLSHTPQHRVIATSPDACGVVLMIVVDYVRPVEFRSPPRCSILAPYLVLFFGAILLMGLPMFWLDRGLWLITVFTTALMLGSMGVALPKGVG